MKNLARRKIDARRILKHHLESVKELKNGRLCGPLCPPNRRQPEGSTAKNGVKELHLQDAKMIRSVTGFMFSTDRTRVALIAKLQPAWQSGRLNGVGGKI